MKVNIGKGINLDLDANALPSNVMDHVVMIGLRNILMDSHAGITKADHPADYMELSRAKAEAKWNAMLAGDIRIARQSSGVTRDPVRAEALKMARKTVSAVFYFASKDSAWKIRDAAQWVELKAEYGETYDFNDADALRDLFDLLCESVADTCMDEAEMIVETRNAVKKPVSLAGLVKK